MNEAVTVPRNEDIVEITREAFEYLLSQFPRR